jgi:hypothetical protein
MTRQLTKTMTWRLVVAASAALTLLAAGALAPDLSQPGLSAFEPTHASAATVRYKTWNRYDVMLSGDETRAAGSSIGGAAFTCATTPLVAGVYGMPACTAMVGVCAARAKVRHRWAGMTVQPFTLGYWCWDY